MCMMLQVMDLMELSSLKGSLVGLPGHSGLSVEQRKRLTIGVELVANPSIVFMVSKGSSQHYFELFSNSLHAWRCRQPTHGAVWHTPWVVARAESNMDSLACRTSRQAAWTRERPPS